MPQFDFFIYTSLTFSTLIMTFFLYIFIAKSVIPSISKSIKIRAKVIHLSKKKSCAKKRDIYNEIFKSLF